MSELLRSKLGGMHDELWKLKCSLNRRWPREGALTEPASFHLRGASVAPLGKRPALCVVVHTHGRPAACARLLETLHETLDASGQRSRFVLVLNDPSAHDYGDVLAVLAHRFPGEFAFFEASRHLGKQGYWFVHQHSFDLLAALRPAHTLFVQDDLSFGPGFVADALALWERIPDPRKTVLYLMSASDDEPHGRWIRFPRRTSDDGAWRLTGWFDLQAFLVGPRFFELLSWQVYAPSRGRWRKDARRSSGVGEQFTRRLKGRGSIYQVGRTLVFHGHEASLMNPEARAIRALDNRPPLEEPQRTP